MAQKTYASLSIEMLEDMSSKQLRQFISREVSTANSRIRSLKSGDNPLWDNYTPLGKNWNAILAGENTKGGYFSKSTAKRVGETESEYHERLVEKAHQIRKFLSQGHTKSAVQEKYYKQLERQKLGTYDEKTKTFEWDSENAKTAFEIMTELINMGYDPSDFGVTPSDCETIINNQLNIGWSADDIINYFIDKYKQAETEGEENAIGLYTEYGEWL